jgi:hypothetical protein
MYAFHVELAVISGSTYEWKEKEAVEGTDDLVLH